MCRMRAYTAVIRVYDEAGNVIETHEHASDFKDEKIKCLMVAPATIASKNTEQNVRSTTGVPVMPSGLMLPHGRPEVTGAPT